MLLEKMLQRHKTVKERQPEFLTSNTDAAKQDRTPGSNVQRLQTG